MKQAYQLSLPGLAAQTAALRAQCLARPDFRGTFEYGGHTYYEFGQQEHPEAPPDFDLNWAADQLQLCRYDYEEPWEGLEWLQSWLADRLGVAPAWEPA